MRKLLLLILLLFSHSIFSQILSGKVISIKDGDTVVVLDSLKQSTTLRLAEIDCPEKKQPFGNRAKQFTSSQIYLATINYVVTDMDRYGRAIAMIYYGDDNKYLSAELVRNGMAWHYKKYSNSKELAELEISAREKKIGLWSDPNPIMPSEWRTVRRKK
ncbi:thermonuclease family protein [Yeosuana sp. MJ-SS3]|uniref:Thermonuclease family protein n=1 Tax=Gilvirhabdus luticola TaxID=3079858 RepID=A0ABU3U7D7_9FLAO|nr:thermonuclease family protein [Yeosuana sp. MJ-SS3]MDU8886322.1 thermonuclease family protein [Yeosuana sp. MJ-SS3]